MILIKLALWWIVISVPAWVIMIGLAGAGVLPRALILSDTYKLHSVAPSISFFGLILWWFGINIERAVKNANNAGDNPVPGFSLIMAVAASILSVFCVLFVWMLSEGDLLGTVMWFTVLAFPLMLPVWFIAIVSSWQHVKEKNEEALAVKKARAADEAAKAVKKIEVAS